MKDILEFIANHSVLTVILALVVIGGLAECIKAALAKD